ncbi:cysteine protease [Stylonychia lemnae]|uniref:Cysteine protease n=1 Tax=Stylonychia lemnae TaxID=5949 RepID=A0A078AM52_STYLE|nr:cysteine protease [Stylonychia lemnae]|eukprot:CDW82961.1 cysteine protease [Stylonychia lemnae]
MRLVKLALQSQKCLLISFTLGVVSAIFLFTTYDSYLDDYLYLQNIDNQSKLEFSNFLASNLKNYQDLQTFVQRLKIFIDNKSFIQKSNKENKDFQLIQNYFSDQTEQEYKQTLTLKTQKNVKNIKKIEQVVDQLKNLGNTNAFKTISKAMPQSLDWRYSNIVTAIKNQGSCGSCYAFASTASLESLLLLQDKNKFKGIDLSEQQLLDCSDNYYGNSGCRGGDMYYAFAYLKQNKIQSESTYPYIGKDSLCRYDANKGIINIKGQIYFSTDNTTLIKEQVLKGPITVGMDASSPYFRQYSSGIITTTKCGTSLNHAVIIIGYGLDKGLEYWIIKNQYGTRWGERGFARIKMQNGQGICGLNQYIVIPVLN